MDWNEQNMFTFCSIYLEPPDDQLEQNVCVTYIPDNTWSMQN